MWEKICLVYDSVSATTTLLQTEACPETFKIEKDPLNLTLEKCYTY